MKFIWKAGEICHFTLYKDQKGLTDKLETRKLFGLVIYSSKDQALKAVRRDVMFSSKLGLWTRYVKGVPLVNVMHMKGVPFGQKWCIEV